jgi:hypothetical protein
MMSARRTPIHKEQPMSEQPTSQAPVMESGVGAIGGLVGLTPRAQQYLDETRPWVRFISILTFVMAGFMLLGGLGLLAFTVLGGLAARDRLGIGALGGAIGGGLLASVYVVMALVYLAPGTYLFRYASAIARLRATASGGALEDALKHQKSFWRFVGIITVISFVLALVAMVVGVVVAVIAAVTAARS